ncbi:MAG: carboxymuconolactone decarboxylase family protein [Frankia sp.]
MTTSTPAIATPPRLDLSAVLPSAYRALRELDGVSRKVGLEPRLLELVRLRASQINGCAFCMDMHTLDAQHAGEDETRLAVISAWREARHLYTEREQAALALTESVTLLSETHVPDDVWTRAAAVFPDEQLAGLLTAIIAINAWNRLGVSTRMVPGEYKPS